MSKLVAVSVMVLSMMVLSTQALSQSLERPFCHHRLFTVAETKRAADLIYRGTHNPTKHDIRMLGRMERCQRNPMAQVYVRQYDRRQATIHAQHVYNASHPWSSAHFTEYFPGGGGIEGGIGMACGGSWSPGDYYVANDQLPCGYQG